MLDSRRLVRTELALIAGDATKEAPCVAIGALRFRIGIGVLDKVV